MPQPSHKMSVTCTGIVQMTEIIAIFAQTALRLVDSIVQLFLFAGLVAVGVLVWLWRTRPKLVKPVPWTLVDALAGFLVGFILIEFYAGAMLQIFFGDSLGDEMMRRVTIVFGGLVKPVVALAVLAVILRLRRARIRDLCGDTTVPLAQSFFVGFVIFLASLPMVFLAGHIYKRLSQTFGLPVEKQLVVQMLMNESDPWMLSLLILAGIVIAPILEETFFRGFLYPALKQRFGMIGAAIALSVGFSLLHGNVQAALPLFLLSMALIGAYELTGSLWAAIVTHAYFNAFFVFIALQMEQ